uniref:Uncharacterized protein n=1 Tax=Glossina brevipalpis TaxID=37001 RepID=A0A1A9WIB6_9MUSC
MSLGTAAGVLLKHQTPLQQLLEDINFQRNKEMRQLLKDDSGFVVLQGTTYWTDLFVRHFLFQSEPVHSIDSDDLLFFVRKKHVKSSSRHMPKYETEVDVFRKDSRKLPIGDPDVDWEETVYLNMVIHQFDYTLTLAICTRTSPKELQVLRRHSQRVYASPSRRKMDTKGEGEEITYPHICFMVDNFDEVFSDILVRDGEMVCVELVANDKDGAVQGVIFLGSIRYDALKKVYDARQSSLSTKVAQRMSFGLFSSGAGVQTRCEFVRMKGPQGKGHAEMAVTKPKGSGVETPTSEPGYLNENFHKLNGKVNIIIFSFCATDMWDDWEEDNGDYCSYGHQRRLSDPSANLNNFSRYAWRTKSSADAIGGVGSSVGAKARSENEGLDSLANEVSEIEAGDLRDDLRPAFSASKEQLHNHSNRKNTVRSENEQNSKETTPAISEEANKCKAEDATLEVVADTLEEANDALISVPKSAATPKKTTSNKSTGCAGNCFKTGKKCKKRWVLSSDTNTPEMSEIYCPTCDDFANETPACLNKMPDPKNKIKSKNIANIESELVISKRGSLRLNEKKVYSKDRLIRSSSLNAADRKKGKKTETLFNKKEKPKTKDKDKEKEKDKIKEKLNKANSLLAKVSPKRIRANRNQIPIDGEKIKNKKDTNCHNISKNSKKVLNQEKSVAKQISENLDNNELTSLHEYEIADDAISLSGIELTQGVESEAKIAILTETDTKLMIAVRGQEELPVVEQSTVSSAPQTATTNEAISNTFPSAFSLTNSPSLLQNDNPIRTKFEFAKCVRVPVKNDDNHPSSQTLQTFANDANTENDFEFISSSDTKESSYKFNLKVDDKDNYNDNNYQTQTDINRLSPMSPMSTTSPVKINPTTTSENKSVEKQEMSFSYSSTTLPRTKRSDVMLAHYNRIIHLVPKRRTADGTNIYYWCDVPKQALKELDDGAYNPLWASRGFAQSFHFWKENKRQQSSPLNAFLTYVTLPWWSIAKDLLDHRETPILTF